MGVDRGWWISGYVLRVCKIHFLDLYSCYPEELLTVCVYPLLTIMLLFLLVGKFTSA